MNISGVGGMERITLRLASQLCQRGYRVIIISLFGSGIPFFPCDEGIEHVVLFKKKPNNYLSYFSITKKMRNVFKEYGIDFNLDVGVVNSLFSLPASIGLKTRVISWEHFNYQMPQIRSRLWITHRVITRYSSAIVTLTEEDVCVYKSQHPASRAKIVCISNFLESLPEETSDMNIPCVIAVGRLNFQKGFDVLLSCWKKVLAGGQFSSWTLKIIGSGEEESLLKQMSRELRIDNSVEFIPSTNNIGDYYRNASIYAMSSRYEGFGLVLIEAKSYGLPIVSFDCRMGPREIVRNNIDGIVVADKDTVSFISSLQKLMRDKELRVKMSKETREDANRFMPETIVNQWEELFTNLLCD